MSEITAVGVFEDRRRALSAVEGLRQAGFADEEIGLISREDSEAERPAWKGADEPRSKDETGLASVGVGAAAGAAAGVGTGLALAAGLVPGIGPVVAGGALTLLMAGSGATA